MNLYEIDTQYTSAMNSAINPYTGEIVDDKLFSEFEKLAEQKEKKILNIAAMYKNIIADAQKIKLEKLKLARRQKVCENKAESLKRYVRSFISEKEKYSDARVSVSWRKSHQVNVYCEADILPEEFQNIKITADKKKIKDAIDSGIHINHCNIKENNNLQIK